MLIAILAPAYRRTARLAKNHDGSTAIEYALIASLISLGIIAGLSSTGNSVAEAFGYVMTEVGSAMSGN